MEQISSFASTAGRDIRAVHNSQGSWSRTCSVETATLWWTFISRSGTTSFFCSFFLSFLLTYLLTYLLSTCRTTLMAFLSLRLSVCIELVYQRPQFLEPQHRPAWYHIEQPNFAGWPTSWGVTFCRVHHTSPKFYEAGLHGGTKFMCLHYVRTTWPAGMLTLTCLQPSCVPRNVRLVFFYGLQRL